MKNFFLCAAILFFCSQTSHAANIWVWGNDDINIFIEDSELEWNENEKEFSVTVIDVVKNHNIKGRNKFMFYRLPIDFILTIMKKSNNFCICFFVYSFNKQPIQ